MKDLANSQLSALADSLNALSKQVKERFDGVDKKFVAVDKRFDGIDRKFESMEKRFDRQDDLNFDQFKKVHQRIDKLEVRLDERIDKLEIRLDERVDGVEAGFNKSHSRLDSIDVSLESVKRGLAVVEGKLDFVRENQAKHETRISKLEINSQFAVV